MQRYNLFKIVGIGVISLSAAIAPLVLPASAQVNAPETETSRTTQDNDFDWGWLGLLGLAGLAGLAGKKHSDNTVRRDPDPLNRGTYRE
jgi:hypothetical protein